MPASRSTHGGQSGNSWPSTTMRSGFSIVRKVPEALHEPNGRIHCLADHTNWPDWYFDQFEITRPQKRAHRAPDGRRLEIREKLIDPVAARRSDLRSFGKIHDPHIFLRYRRKFPTIAGLMSNPCPVGNAAIGTPFARAAPSRATF